MHLRMVVISYGKINERSNASLYVVLFEKRRLLSSVGSGDIEARLVRREVKCRNDLCINGGSYFYYDKSQLVTIVEIILGQSADLLLIN